MRQRRKDRHFLWHPYLHGPLNCVQNRSYPSVYWHVVVGHFLLRNAARKLPLQGKEWKRLVWKNQERPLWVHPQPNHWKKQEIHRILTSSLTLKKTHHPRCFIKVKQAVALWRIPVWPQNLVSLNKLLTLNKVPIATWSSYFFQSIRNFLFLYQRNLL